MDVSMENSLKLEHQKSFLGKYEKIIRETRGNNESTDEIEAWVEEELRNSEEWRPKKAVNERTNIESVILFEDIEPFLMIMEKNNDFSGEILNSFLDFMGKINFICYKFIKLIFINFCQYSSRIPTFVERPISKN